MKNLFFVAVFFALATISFAQSSVSGIVKDENNAVVAGAKVTLRNVNANRRNVGITNQSGEFSFQNVDSGSYEISVSADGFGVSKQTFQLSNEQKKLNFSLEIGSSKYTVTAETGAEISRDSVPQSITTISTTDISQRVTAVLGQAVDEEVGVAFQRTSPTLGGVFIRGLAGKNVNIYVDGVRYTNSAQRGGINTFFNLNEPTNLQSIEVIRGASSAQYGSDSLGGTVSLLSRNINTDGNIHGEFSTMGNSADRSFGNQAFLSFGTDKFGGYVNVAQRRVNNLRTAQGIDTHSAVTRFLGLSSKVLGSDRVRDSGFTQYGGSVRLNYAPTFDNQFVFYYQRNQQDLGKRADQLQSGDGNLISDLRNLQGDFAYIRYNRQGAGFFDNANFTASYNAQREERVNQGGQGDPFGNITHQPEKTKVYGGSFFFDKQVKQANFLFGGDYYNERIVSPAYTITGLTATNSVGVSRLSRPRVPDNARFVHGGIYVQNSLELLNEKLRVSSAIRYGVANYSARQADSPIVGGVYLWGDDSLRDKGWSGRVGFVGRLSDNLNVAFNYARGFRYPAMTDLGTLGLTGDGFEIDFNTANSLGGTIGTTADGTAISTGIGVKKQGSELSDNLDFSIRYSHKRFETDFTAFRLDINNAITKQALILPAGAVGRRLGDQTITSQSASGVVFVPASSVPVLIRANYTDARLYGFEYELDAKLMKNLSFRGNYTYVKSADKVSKLPPNIEGGTPPPTGFLSLKFTQPRFFVEAYSTLAARQDRLSTLDLSDRRTGATRTRTQIQNYFRRGACVLGLTNNPTGVCGTAATNTLISTGETLPQVQNRVLGTANSAPLFTYLPGYGLFNLRGSVNITKKITAFAAFENIFDKIYRNPSWGIDGAGRSVTLQLRYKF